MKKTIITILSLLLLALAGYFILPKKTENKNNVKFETSVKNNITTVKWELDPNEKLGYIISYKSSVDGSGAVHTGFVRSKVNSIDIEAKISVDSVSTASYRVGEKAEVIDIDIISMDSSQEKLNNPYNKTLVPITFINVNDIDTYINSSSFPYKSKTNIPRIYFNFRHFGSVSSYSSNSILEFDFNTNNNYPLILGVPIINSINSMPPEKQHHIFE